MIKIIVKDVTNPEKEEGQTEYDISMEEMEKVMDAHCDKIMTSTLTSKSTLWFPDGRVVEYRWDEENNCIWKRIGKIKREYATDKTKL
jgi:hypothetical protein